MTSRATNDAQAVILDSLRDLENPKGSVAAAVQKLHRAAGIIGDRDIEIWCAIQLGDTRYTLVLQELLNAATVPAEAPKQSKADEERLNAALLKVSELGLKPLIHYSQEELTTKLHESGGGYANVGFVEERYADLVRMKRGNDGTYYKTNLVQHLAYVRRAAHERATALYKRLAYADTPQSAFDILKAAVDDRLLDFAPQLAEALMTAFHGVTLPKQEEWSQALTTCRRFIEGLADVLYSPRDEPVNGRQVGKANYINRLWAFMDNAIESDSNRELAKAHVDLLGSYLERLHKQTNKGVHASVDRIEAVKAVFHLYLLAGDLLQTLQRAPSRATARMNIYSASLDDLQTFLKVSRKIAKEIIKLRVANDQLAPESLANIDGVGPRTIARAREHFSFEKPTI